MGYTHGIKWDLVAIKEHIMGMVKSQGLDRMPSRSECEAFFGNTALTNAISKRIGWRRLAREMELPIKRSETAFGNSYEMVACNELSLRGFDVKKMPQNFPYDILVNGCVKVDVKASRLYKGNNGNFFSFNLEKPFCTCDIYLLYCINTDTAQVITLVVPSKFVAAQSQISVGEHNSKYYRFSNRFHYIKDYCEFMESVG